MSHATQNGARIQFSAINGFHLPAIGTPAGSIKDAGQVRVGGFGPVFRLAGAAHTATGMNLTGQVAAVSDAGTVRLGGFGPVFRLADGAVRTAAGMNLTGHVAAVSDAGTVRLGGFGPLFR